MAKEGMGGNGNGRDACPCACYGVIVIEGAYDHES